MSNQEVKITYTIENDSAHIERVYVSGIEGPLPPGINSGAWYTLAEFYKKMRDAGFQPALHVVTFEPTPSQVVSQT